MKKSTLFALIILSLIFLNPLQASKEDKYFRKYIKKVQRKIKSNWHPGINKTGYVIVSEFNLDLNGNILGDIKFTKSIDDPIAMKAAREAILNAAPFEKIDQKITKIPPSIEFSFAYKNHFARANSKEKSNSYIKKYTSNVQSKIKRNWHPPKQNKKYSITAEFELDFNGEISGDIKFIKTIKDPEAMKAAKEAILNAAPFEKIDQKIIKTKPTIEFEFKYNHSRDIDDDGDLPIEILRKKK